MLDRWTLIHFAFWLVIGANIHWLSIPIWLGAVIVIGGAYAWEVIEMYMEKYEFVSGKESSKNRWISDPLISVIGAVAGFLWVSLW